MPQFYRFSHPKSADYPAMIELFSRRTDALTLPEDARLTPLPMEESVSSLSAILLDDAYYAFLRGGRKTVDGISVLDAEHLIPFKIKAWLDLTRRKAEGEAVDSRSIRKHKNDVFRLTELLRPSTRVQAPAAVLEDVRLFTARMADENVDLRALGLEGTDKETILREIMDMYV